MNIIELAKQVGYPIQHPEWQKATEEFAALVEAHEREACAKVCDLIRGTDMNPAWDTAAAHCAAAIRARSKA